VTFSGRQLRLNYSTSAIGCIRCEIRDDRGAAINGFALDDMDPLFGDQLDRVVAWRGGSDLSALVGRTVRFRFALKDADLFAMRTAE